MDSNPHVSIICFVQAVLKKKTLHNDQDWGEIYENLRLKWTNVGVIVMAPLECFACEIAFNSIFFTYHLHLLLFPLGFYI